ncbi:MAG: formylmethanofuran dehydrogenase [Desulfobulbaceae bacterium]|nr:MAG: formylmethanofuran dehydrogenase [Desulfobulbaceae bacterium]
MQKEFSDVVRFHGHACPGLAFGYRVAAAALEALGPCRPRQELVAVVENKSCAVDAIQVVTGCTFGKGNLVLDDYGKQVYSFMTRDGHGVRIAVIWEPPPESTAMQQVWHRFQAGDRDPEIMQQIAAHKGKKVRAILEAAPEDLFKVEKRQFKVPAAARVFKSLRCSHCQEKVMEPMAQVKDDIILCIPCRNAMNVDANTACQNDSAEVHSS